VKRQIAEELTVELRAIFASLNRMSEITMQMPEDDARKSLRGALGRLMVDLDYNVLKKIGQEYPDLDFLDA
jgi:hypothetical protein